jgi:hypothetical protein
VDIRSARISCSRACGCAARHVCERGPKACEFHPKTLGDQPPGAVVLGKEDGTLAVGVAAAPRPHGQLLVVATVLSGTGIADGATGLDTKFAITTANCQRLTARSRTCTAGCYQAVFATSGLPKQVTVSFNNGSHTDFAMPRRGPSSSGLRLVSQAAAEYEQIHSMVTQERLAALSRGVTPLFPRVAEHVLWLAVWRPPVRTLTAVVGARLSSGSHGLRVTEHARHQRQASARLATRPVAVRMPPRRNVAPRWETLDAKKRSVRRW